MENQKEKTDLSKFFGKELVYVETFVKYGALNHRETIKKVYNPKDFNCKHRPCNGSDVVIGGNSWNSEIIFEIGGVMKSPLYNDKYFTLHFFNFCQVPEVETVKKMQKFEAKKSFQMYIDTYSAKIKAAKSILLNISK